MRPPQVRIDIRCSVNECRRLLGRPDVSPLMEWLSLAIEEVVVAGMATSADKRLASDGPARQADRGSTGRPGKPADDEA